MITTCILLAGSLAVIYNAVLRVLNPVEIDYNGMIVFAVVGAAVNILAAYFTHGGHSLNQRAVNLHMLEDVLGWIVVLVGAVVMKFTDFSLIDPIMSIAVALFIFVNAVRNLGEVLELFLEKTPSGIDVNELREHLTKIEGVRDVHHIHIWSMDGRSNYATMHIVTDGDGHSVKHAIREELSEHGIGHVTLELEAPNEHCHEESCQVSFDADTHGHHHGHHHHH